MKYIVYLFYLMIHFDLCHNNIHLLAIIIMNYVPNLVETLPFFNMKREVQ